MLQTVYSSIINSCHCSRRKTFFFCILFSALQKMRWHKIKSFLSVARSVYSKRLVMFRIVCFLLCFWCKDYFVHKCHFVLAAELGPAPTRHCKQVWSQSPFFPSEMYTLRLLPFDLDSGYGMQLMLNWCRAMEKKGQSKEGLLFLKSNNKKYEKVCWWWHVETQQLREIYTQRREKASPKLSYSYKLTSRGIPI